ncbi:MAG: UDP-N-acetylmuramoyl-tripeptide--D-alanyl-D-alanine ligase [Proteobacteria bacterium]|nr:UDP-N-acetylmuramoyl-tripeptide--D-alanyl-D-alanine ligase [Pseudomonadota bacterium]
MDPLSLSEIASMAGALLTAGDPSAIVSRISKDTRDIRPGDLYVALRGERFDGNAFLAEAAAKGAVAALCDAEPPVGLPSHFGILSTSDCLAGLTLLAAAWRERLKLRSVVITGSSGKTSTKDFTAAVLGARLQVTATRGNLNNHIGLPLSILSASSSDEAAVWEIGMNHRGEIASLAGLASPNIGIITGVGSAHIEHLGSREEIAREKGDLLERIQPNGCAILPAADDFIIELRSRTSAKVIEVGIGIGDLRAVNLRREGWGTRFEIEGEFGKTETFLPVPGRHMVGNALLAIAAGVLCDIPLGECSIALGAVALTGGRLGILERNGATILDDTYNANPESMIAALETLCSHKGRRIAVLGRMGELGFHAGDAYRRIGVQAASSADLLVCVGEEAAAIAEAATKAGLADVRLVPDTKAAADMLSGILSPGVTVLLKASRSARLEEILQHLA